MSEPYSKEIELYDNTSISIDGLKVIVEGPNATLERDFNHARRLKSIRLDKQKNNIIVEADYSKKKFKSIVGTVSTHIKNMLKGSVADFKVIQKIVYAHFPATVRIEGRKVYIDNFLGERTPRVAKITGDQTQVSVSGDDVIISGPNIEHVTQTAANITLATKIKNKDPRIFQDGIYKYKKLYADNVIWELKL
ncbi:MAG: 50S ribosomal protein L6 [Candidatus Lokiarchaeota archaeon]|nr:50S ribosomal protein L6 [Candidatus Lokiarchaeota archaeon]